ncbi:hypothetical protein [Paramagnetospirillum caucaseum]|uniref:hypothetical protein n=1 Tax=Paramagnetospirillum caucaseum TaxID=1244869 RepID=UPI001267A826|nr:hypothetical protein [Paramagnetospirillum caucaseum]
MSPFHIHGKGQLSYHAKMLFAKRDVKMNFQWPRFTPFKTVNDIEKRFTYENFSKCLVDGRSQFKIVVIDDETFTPIENLRRNNYDIVHMPDIHSIDALSKFNIVLCDLNGVGVSLNPTLQGAHIIAEIKKSYPEKIVVAYTGGGFQQDMIERSIQASDYFLRKDANVEEWCERLDTAISDLANPAIVWKKLRHRLLDAGLTPYKLAVVEDLFVEKTLHGRPFSLSDLDTYASRFEINGTAKAILKKAVIDVGFEIAKEYIKG